MNDSGEHELIPHRRGAVAVVVRADRFLVIRRSALVVAPGALCFPGGGIEVDETEEQALVREFREELGAAIRPVGCIWRSTTRWQTRLAWWFGEIDEACQLAPNPQEVATLDWLPPEAMLAEPDLLESNRAFLEALARGEIVLPT